ncbi:MAG TPA: YceD family protein, partial [Acidimicrobiales bacterium]
TDGETFPLEGDHLDLGPMVHDTVLLALPLAPLCGPDCLGPAPDEFPTTVAADPDGPAEPARDPRWAALDDLDLS